MVRSSAPTRYRQWKERWSSVDGRSTLRTRFQVDGTDKFRSRRQTIQRRTPPEFQNLRRSRTGRVWRRDEVIRRSDETRRDNGDTVRERGDAARTDGTRRREALEQRERRQSEQRQSVERRREELRRMQDRRREDRRIQQREERRDPARRPAVERRREEQRQDRRDRDRARSARTTGATTSASRRGSARSARRTAATVGARSVRIAIAGEPMTAVETSPGNAAMTVAATTAIGDEVAGSGRIRCPGAGGRYTGAVRLPTLPHLLLLLTVVAIAPSVARAGHAVPPVPWKKGPGPREGFRVSG